MSIVHEPNLFALHGGLYQLYPLYLFLRRQLSGRKVLELDCGSGQGASLLAGGLAEEVIGVDRDAGAIEAASASHHSPLLGFRLLEQEDELPFHEASFDAVLALRRPFDPFRQPLIREITRVLTPAGLLVAALPNPALAGLPVPGTMAALDSAPITAHQLRLELRRTFTEVQLVAQSPLLGFFFHELALTDAAQRHVALDSSLVEGRLEEPYGWLAVCSRAGSLGLQATLVRLSFDDLVAVLREEAEQELERAGRILGEEARLQGYQEKLVAIHEQARWSDESATAAAGAEPSAANPAAATAASRPPDSAPAGGTPPAAGEPGFSPARLAELEQAARERDELAARLASCEQQLAAGEEQRRTLPRQLEVAGARQQQEENARLATDHDRTCAELEEAQCQLAALKTQLIATGCELQAALAERRFLAAEGQAEQQAILARLASLEALAARVPQLEQQLAEQGQANGDREQELHEAQRQLTEQELRTRQLQQLLEKEEEAARQLQQNLMVQQSAMQQL
ncbi:MAG: methyltransferase domain-containing protein, partial [Deltaproteobacteria bacterium]|nr:methyltransferase domain-containing protein [Deltaproteobacteria bacterium]